MWFSNLTVSVLPSRVMDCSGRLSRMMLTSGDVRLLFFVGCAFDVTIRDTLSMLCSLFTEHDVAILNYANDLKYWYRYGAGHPVGSRMAVMLVRDFFSAFLKGTRGEINGTWRFCHSETVVPFMTLLG
eukprot:Hpha_TRINITY_DN9469_c0_g1::TRINITY_DN9469_c0_g1_i1::g.139104::m.139104/K03103/MINPP1; multiple inositol-polyphosphate phosphatase / 2,3-bisphosphoglycerate 3-phosphatase